MAMSVSNVVLSKSRKRELLHLGSREKVRPQVFHRMREGDDGIFIFKF